MKKLYFLLVFAVLSSQCFAQKNVGIGTSTPGSTLQVAGSFSAQWNNVTSTPYALASTDYFVSYSGSSAGTFNLPMAIAGTGNFIGRIYVIKNATSYNLVINAYAANTEQIDGLASVTLAPGNTISLISNGVTGSNVTTWNITGTTTASGSSTGWSSTGNAGTTPSSSAIGTAVNNNVLGTTDSKDLVIATNDLERVRVTSSGSVGINNSSPNTSAALDIASTSQGILPPRMTTTQRNAITSGMTTLQMQAIQGLTVFNTSTNCLESFIGTAWQPIGCGCTSAPAAPGAITYTPSGATICEGYNNFIFSVSEVAGASSYIWTLPTGASIANGSGTSAITVNFSNTAATGAQTVSVVASNSCGSSASTSLGITVNAIPVINSQPSSSAICALGGTNTGNTSFTVGATGTALLYQWQVNSGTGWNNLANGGVYSNVSASNVTTSTLNITGASTAYSSYQFQCVISGTCSPSVTTIPVTLTVNGVPTATMSATTSAVCQNTTAPNITFTGAGGIPPYTFTYNINGGSNTTITTSSGNSVNLAISTASTGTFTYNLVSIQDASSTACTQSQPGSSTIIVNTTPSAPSSASASPTNICNGSSSNLNGVSTGNTINWYTVASGGTPIGSSASGANYAVSPTTTTTYYAEAQATGSSSQTFSYTGSVQTFTVPPGITSITVDAYGAQGGSSAAAAPGGLGGEMKATITGLTSGQVLDVYVGGAGTAAGYNGGGTPGSNGGGGGGASDVRVSSYGLTNRIVVAGGGAGAGENCNTTQEAGGVGGGATGGTGYQCNLQTGGYTGVGGSQSAGGAYGNDIGQGCGGAGSLGIGGNGACTFGGGGGGGYYGGGGGGFGGGGGGSSYTSGTVVTNTQGTQSGNGKVIISYSAQLCPSPGRTAATVTVTPSTSTASITGGGGQSICQNSTAPTSLSATAPTQGTGTWSVTAGPTGYAGHVTFGTSTASTTTVAADATAPAGSYTITWAITNSPCGTSSTTTTITVTANPTLTAATQSTTVCAGSPAGINLTGLVASSTATVSYTIGGGAVQTASVVASSGGAGSFTTPALSYSNNGQTLQITNITSNAGCSINFATNATLAVNPTPTLTGATQNANICAGSGATINLTGLLPGTTSTITYNIGGGANLNATGVVSTAGGTASFTTTALPVADNGLTLLITTVTRTDNTPNCPATVSVPVTLVVNSLPTVTVAALPTSVCINSTTTLTATPAGGSGTYSSYAWSSSTTGNGMAASTTSTNTATPTTAATQTYTVKVTDNNGCQSSAAGSVNVTVNALPTITSVGTVTAVCYNSGSQTTVLPYTATTNSPTSYAITWSSAANTAGLTNQASTSYTFASGAGSMTGIVIPAGVAAGTYTGTLTVTNANTCSNATPLAISLTINALPTITTTGVANAVCASSTVQTTTLPYTATTGSPTSYSIAWTGIANQTSTSYAFVAGGGSMPSITIPAGTGAGTYNGTLTITNGNTCTNTQAISVTINPLPTVTVAAGTNPLCNGSTTTLTATPSGGSGTYTTYAWSSSTSGNGMAASTTASNSATPTTAGTQTYSVLVTDNNGCQSSVAGSTSVTVNALPTASTANAATGITSTTFGASWSAVTSTPAVTGYILEVATANTFGSADITGYTAANNVGNVTSATVTIPGCGTYYYRITAVSSCGNGTASNIITVSNTPGAPVATAATSITNTTFVANWGAVTSNPAVTGYILEVATANTFGAADITGYTATNNVGTVTTASVTVGGCASAYYYRVTPVNTCGNGTPSNIITVSPPSGDVNFGTVVFDAAASTNPVVGGTTLTITTAQAGEIIVIWAYEYVGAGIGFPTATVTDGTTNSATATTTSYFDASSDESETMFYYVANNAGSHTITITETGLAFTGAEITYAVAFKSSCSGTKLSASNVTNIGGTSDGAAVPTITAGSAVPAGSQLVAGVWNNTAKTTAGVITWTSNITTSYASRYAANSEYVDGSFGYGPISTSTTPTVTATDKVSGTTTTTTNNYISSLCVHP